MMTSSGITKIGASLVCLAAAAAGQQDEMDALRREVRELKSAITAQRDAYDKRIEELETRLGEMAAQDRAVQIDQAISDRVRFYTKPDAVKLYPSKGLFESVEGGLFFTGLFRSRFEARVDNVDFNSEDTGLDDSGYGFNGRFRLGFGAALYREVLDGAESRDESPRRLQVTALTEFQSYGTFANNSYVNVPSAAGLPVPFAFNILTEPFEDVGLYQGYLYFQKLLDESVNIKVGRQEMVFGNELILGNNSFYDGTVHDGLVVSLDRKLENDWRLSFAYAKQAASDSGIASSVKSFDEDEFFTFYGEIFPSDELQIDAYALYYNARSGVNDIFVTGSTAFIFDGALTPPILGRHWTIGSRVQATKLEALGGRLTLSGEAAFQFGEDDSSAAGRRSIHGWTAEFVSNFRFEEDSDLKPIATVAYLYAGGGEPGANGAIGFQPLFVNRHFEALQLNAREVTEKIYYPGGGRYGNMDEIPLFNIHTFKAAVSVEATRGVEIGAAYIFAATADDQGYGTGVYGHEFDVFASYTYSNNLQFAANFGVFFPGKTARDFSNLLFFSDPASPNLASGSEVALSFYLQALLQF
jgi:hypothetical protein